MRLQRILPLAAGLLGILVCIVGVVLVWTIGARLNRANARLFQFVRISLTVVEDRVVRLERRAAASRVTADEMRQSVVDWAKKESGEYAAKRLKLSEKLERLAAGVQQADLLLEMSAEGLQRTQRAVELADTLGLRLDSAVLDQPLSRLRALGEKVRDAAQTVDQLRENIDRLTEEDSLVAVERGILRLVARAAATLADIDEQLDGFSGRLTDLQIRAQALESRVYRSVLAGEITLTAVAILMAIGQIMIFRSGLRRRTGPTGR